MNKPTNLHAKKTEPTNPLLNAAIIAAVSLAILPAAIFGAVRILHTRIDASAKAAETEEAAPKRSSIAERRARRLEARKAKEAKAAKFYPEITLETVEPYYDAFEMEYDADMEFNGFGMMPPAYLGGPGMMPPAYMGNPGMMPGFNRGNFNGIGRMPGAGMGFDNGFGRGRGNY